MSKTFEVKKGSEAEIAAVLQKEPDNPAYLAAFAGLRLQAGQADEAVGLLRRALELAPDDWRIVADFGAALVAGGRLDEAEAVLRMAVSMWGFPDLRFNLARCLEAAGRYSEALAVLEPLSDPDEDVLKLRGDLFRNVGNHDAAIRAYLALLQKAPANAVYLNDLGVALELHGEPEQRRRIWQQFADSPGAPGIAFYFLGNAHNSLGEVDAARTAYRRAIELEPNLAEAMNNLALIEAARGNEVLAAEMFARAAAINPALAAPRSNLGALKSKGNAVEEAAEILRQAVRLDPQCTEARANYGAALMRLHRFAEAEEQFRQVLAREPGNASAELNLGLLKLGLGDLEQGWPYYESRWKHPQLKAKRPPLASPEWHGEPLDGKTLLVFSEQGFGDNLQFVRYLLELKRRFPTVVLHYLSTHALCRLLQENLPAGICNILPWGAEIPPHDLHSPLLSLPWRCGTGLHSIPWPGIYLSADHERRGRCAAELAQVPGRKVGIVWASSETFIYRSAKTVHLSALMPLFSVAGVGWVNLQFGREAEQIGDCGLQDKIYNPMASVQDFADTAAIIANLDLVIAVDTAVAHLAGAMGKPVWMLDRFDTDWRWLPPREDSPWYPSMRIFRQKQIGNWDEVVGRVVGALGDWTHS